MKKTDPLTLLHRKLYYRRNRAKVLARHQAYRAANLEQEKLTKLIYRVEHGPLVNAKIRRYRDTLPDSYVREQLHKRTGRPRESFTAAELETARQALALKRSRADVPPCPTCGERGKKAGFQGKTRNRRYICHPCGKQYSVPIPHA